MSPTEDTMSESPEVAELRQQCHALRRQGMILMVGLVIASFTLTAFLAVQFRRTSKDLEAVRDRRAKLQEAGKKDAQAVQALVAKLSEYGKSHPDFAALLAKFGIREPTNAAPATAPAPAVAPKK